MTNNAHKVFSLDHLLDRDFRSGEMQVAKFGHVGCGGGGRAMGLMYDDEG